MAEIKNSFLQSKMNQDLDDRLIPNGEYRSALNVSVGKSENSDVGTLQNVLGNNFIAGNPIDIDDPNYIPGLECIGYFMDNNNNRIYQFLTNQGDNGAAPLLHQITVYDFGLNSYIVLVQGKFLNFSKASLVTGINLLENLLFWTDYNNQPRKINVQSAISAPATTANPYYTREEQISVAKYAPVDPIALVNVVTTTATANAVASITIFVASTTGIEHGMTVIGGGINDSDFILVDEVISSTELLLYSPVSLLIGDKLKFLQSTMTNKEDDPNWPGDPSYLKSRYVRFSYRFRLDDGEYTLMAPFTQITFIPNQKGYFVDGNENAAYQSTVVKWFENNVNNIELLIPFPDILTNVNQSYKIQAVDILYKESDGLAIHVVETIPYDAFSAIPNASSTNIYTYDYQSRKPYKTLTEDQTTRVYDLVPVKAKAQESAGNRIIYGNFIRNYTAPRSLNYQVSVAEKQDYSLNFIEYPNHTVKQNRTYQVGFILSDKYGRQSSVILSSLDTNTTISGGIQYGGSTVYSPYYSDATAPITKNWFGNAILMLINSPIAPITQPPQPSLGTPGLYAESTSTTGFTLTGTTTTTNTTYEFTPTAGTIPKVGDFMRGAFTDYVEVLTIIPTPANPVIYGVPYTVTTTGRVNDIYNRDTGIPNDIKYVYTINPLGWYSYKIVVRQQEQEYYNVYLPGMLNGYPKGQTYGSETTYLASVPTLVNGINTTVFPTNETNKVAHTVLINDNINKIPRDLVEVGPDQKQYRSSVQLYGRVENVLVELGPGDTYTDNTQYFPPKKADTAITISTTADLSFLPQSVTNEKGSASYNFYQLETQPLVARISTTNKMGVTAVENIEDLPLQPDTYINDPYNMNPYLSVYETKPVYSLLDIFWETSSTGIVSDLNADVLTGFEGGVGLSDIDFEDFDEFANPLDPVTKFITNQFYPISNTNVAINSTNVTLSVRNADDGPSGPTDVSAAFGIETQNVSGVNRYRIFINNNFVFTSAIKLTTFTFTVSFIQAGDTTPTSYVINGRLENKPPQILTPASSPTEVSLTSPTAPPTPIYTLTGQNGAFFSPQPPILPNTLRQEELFWDIVDSGSTPGWQSLFNITTDPITKEGKLYLINTFPSTGIIYTLNVRLRDACTPAGVPVTSVFNKYESKEDFTVITVKLGQTVICGRTWTASNYTGINFQDGTPLVYAKNAAEWEEAGINGWGAWCYYNYNAANFATYGRLYNGWAIFGEWKGRTNNDPLKQFAPNGFHVPYGNDRAYNGSSYVGELCDLEPCFGTSAVSGKAFKQSGTTYWTAPNTGTNTSTFSALPGGFCRPNGTFGGLGTEAYFWTYGVFPATINGVPMTPCQTAFSFLNTSDVFIQNPYPMGWGFSVRFINDQEVCVNVQTSGNVVNIFYMAANGNPGQEAIGGISGADERTVCAVTGCAIEIQ